MRIGIDLGGTKIEGALLAKDGTIALRERVATPRDDYQATLRAIRDLVDQLEKHAGYACSVGIAMPGTIAPDTGLVKNANSTWLNGQPLEQHLHRLLKREVRLANDANCFALSEAADGAAAGASPVFGVILGTGVGGGIVIGGKVLVGAQAIAGEWGHNPLPAMTDAERPGPQCYCGRRGCIETFLSGPALEAEFFARMSRQASATEIAAAADAGDRAAADMIETYTERLARALGSVVNVIDPEVIVLGGGLSKMAALYTQTREKLPAYVFSPTVRTKIVPPHHGDSSGVRGAAWLWPAQ
ncbi:MAG: ROK family protein [Alphaproteobacteria bacterium]